MGVKRLAIAAIACMLVVADVYKEKRVMPLPPFASPMTGEPCPQGNLGWYDVLRVTFCYPREWPQRKASLYGPKVQR